MSKRGLDGERGLWEGGTTLNSGSLNDPNTIGKNGPWLEIDMVPPMFITLFHPWRVLLHLAFLILLWPILATLLDGAGIIHYTIWSGVAVWALRFYLLVRGI